MSSSCDSGSKITRLPPGGRDNFVADTVLRLAQMEATMARLERDGEQARAGLLVLLEAAEQAKRLRAFEQSLRNGREYKIDEMVRGSRDIKQRIERMEGNKSAFADAPYTSFETVNKRLAELGRLESEVARCTKSARRNNHVFLAAMLVMAATAGAYLLPGLGLT